MPASAPVSGRRARSRPAPTTASCSRSTRAATRSRCCGSTARRARRWSVSPVSSGGVEPVSITINRFGLVYVANVGDGGSNYAGFFLTPQGQLIRLPHHTVAVPEGSGVGDVFFNSTGDRLVGTRDNTSLIDSFTVRLDGRLVAAPGSPFPAQSLGPIGAEFRPTNPSQLYVSNAHAGAGLGTVSAFQVSRRGVLTSIGDSPVPDGQTAPCWVEISHDGKYLFAVNTGSAQHLVVRDPARRFAGAARHDAVHQRCRRGRRPTVARTARPCRSPAAAVWSSAPSPSTVAT